MLICLFCAPAKGEVRFDLKGYAHVNGKPFFPIGIYTYQLDRTMLVQLKEAGFNTVVAGFRIDQLAMIDQAGMKAICINGPEWRAIAIKSPALLGWYLMDEPESGKTVKEVLAAYKQLKESDPAHPIGLVHSMFEAISIFRDCADFTMPDIYPVTAKRDAQLSVVAKYVDETRSIHGGSRPCWPFIQIFGGPDVDGGKWAQPSPEEARCMAFLALAHQATGLLYFSYWPQGGETWRSMSALNRDVQRLVPWLVADGTEEEATSSKPAVHLRARRIGNEYMIIAVNPGPERVTAKLHFKGFRASTLQTMNGKGEVSVSGGEWDDIFEPLQVKVLCSNPSLFNSAGKSSPAGDAR
ncbi:MAG: hypothetical protein ACR2H1_02015 [Limisphaerales bacterium]